MKKSRLIVWSGLLALALWSFAVEPARLVQRELALASPHWHGQPLTIAVASDLHVGAPQIDLLALRNLVEQINAAEPDLILLPGDFVYHGIFARPQSPSAIAAELARLRAPLGVFATLGNHDWWEDAAAIRTALEKAGIPVIDNRAVPLKTASEALWLVGIGDDMTEQADPDSAQAMVPAEAQRIVMMHDPANAPALSPQTAVAFAGHTHGGQVRLPLIGALLTPGRSPLAHAYGWIPDLPVATFVTAGVGTSILPIRFYCPPEFVVLRLRSQEKT